MNADISETIKDRELGFQIYIRSLVRRANMLREHATPTNRTNLWRSQFLCQIKNFN